MPRVNKESANRWASAALDRAGYSPQRARDAKREAWWWLKARAAALPGRPLHAGSAVVWTHPGRAELLRVEVPGPAAREVTVEVARSVVSAGTERAAYTGRTGQEISYPVRPGYSAAGVVVAAGRRSGLAVGDRVAAPLAHASVGSVAAASAYPIPPGVTLADAAFVQLGIIARRGVALGGLAPGERVCVLGCGVIGLLAARLAVAGGAEHVTAVARSRRGEPSARASGAGAFLATGEGDDLAGVDAELVIEATGDPQALLDAVEAARKGGRVVVLGSPRGLTRSVPLDAVRSKRVTIVGGHVSTLVRGGSDPDNAFRSEALAFLEQLASGVVTVSDLVQETIDPREAPSFYRRLAGGGPAVAAFDWTLLSERERAGHASRLAAPRLAARGIDFGARPLPARSSNVERLVRDPLSGASGSLGFALVGCGDIGEQNAAAIAAAPNASLVACFDPAAQLAAELAAAHGATSVGSFEELLERPEVEAIFLSVPHDLHAPLAVRAVEAGRHVIVEKPPAESLAAACRMAEAAERHDVAVSVCFPHRYAPATSVARALIAEGLLGELRGSLVSFLTDKPPAYWHGGFSGRAVSDWRASRERAGGGVLIMNLSHYLDLLLHLSGQPVASVASMITTVDPAAEVEDYVSASIRFANDAVGTVLGGAAVPGTWEGRTSTDLRLWGDDGHVSLGERLEAYTLRGTAGLRAGRWHAFDKLPVVALRTAFVSRFATALAEGRPPEVTLEEAIAVQAVIEATYRSATELRPVAIRDVLEEARGAAAPISAGR